MDNLWFMVNSYPLVICYIAIENGPVEIVDFPIKNGGSFHSFLYVYQRVNCLMAINPVEDMDKHGEAKRQIYAFMEMTHNMI